MILTLNDSTSSERAEAQIGRLVLASGSVDVRVHGFPLPALAVILARLPDHWAYRWVNATTVRVSSTPTPTPGGPPVTAQRSLEVWTSNLNFGNGTRADRHDAQALAARGADVVLTQELHRDHQAGTRLADLFGNGWDTFQARGATDQAKAGIATRTGLTSEGDASYSALGGRYGRFITSKVVRLDGRRVTVASVHMDPARSGPAVWRAQVLALAAWVRTRDTPVIIGGDFNASFSAGANGPRSMVWAAKVCGLSKTGNGIDGFLFSPTLRASHPEGIANAATRSDHGFTGRTFTIA